MQGHEFNYSPISYCGLLVENIEEAMKNLNDHKVDMPWGIEEGPAAKWIMFHDSAGNLIELVEFQ